MYLFIEQLLGATHFRLCDLHYIHVDAGSGPYAYIYLQICYHNVSVFSG